MLDPGTRMLQAVELAEDVVCSRQVAVQLDDLLDLLAVGPADGLDIFDIIVGAHFLVDRRQRSLALADSPFGPHTIAAVGLMHVRHDGRIDQRLRVAG